MTICASDLQDPVQLRKNAKMKRRPEVGQALIIFLAITLLAGCAPEATNTRTRVGAGSPPRSFTEKDSLPKRPNRE